MLDRVGAALTSGARSALDREATRAMRTTPPVRGVSHSRKKSSTHPEQSADKK
jgi:hypothetical protein